LISIKDTSMTVSFFLQLKPWQLRHKPLITSLSTQLTLLRASLH
jgi:hypothetical protein